MKLLPQHGIIFSPRSGTATLPTNTASNFSGQSLEELRDGENTFKRAAGFHYAGLSRSEPVCFSGVIPLLATDSMNFSLLPKSKGRLYQQLVQSYSPKASVD